MFLDILDDSIEAIKAYDRTKKLAENQEAYKKIETAFLEASKKFNILFNQVQIVCEQTNFRPSQELITTIRNIVELIQQSYKKKMSSDELNNMLKRDTRILENTFKDEWARYYDASKAEQLIAKLKTIKEITPDKQYTQQVINRINKGRQWPLSEESIKFFNSGLKDGEAIFTGLQFNAKILHFIERIGKDEITIADLDVEIFEWIKKENLATKFKIGFC